MGSIIPFPKTSQLLTNVSFICLQHHPKKCSTSSPSLFFPTLFQLPRRKALSSTSALGKAAPDGTWPCPASPSSSPCAASYQPSPAAVREMSRMRKRSFEQKLFEWRNLRNLCNKKCLSFLSYLYSRIPAASKTCF